MLSRLGFAGRISAISLLALLALWTLGAGLSFITEQPLVASPTAFPLPHQMAAIIELLETSDAARRGTVIDAANSDTLRVTLADKPPVVVEGQRRRKGLEWLISRYVDALGSREFIATMTSSNITERVVDISKGHLWRTTRHSLLIAVALKTGGYAIFEPRGELLRRVFGVPAGYWLGVLGALVGIAALFAVWREAQPLRELSRAVSRFSGDGTPMLIAPRGAPETPFRDSHAKCLPAQSLQTALPRRMLQLTAELWPVTWLRPEIDKSELQRTISAGFNGYTSSPPVM